jgi:hypothetical protein
VKDSPPESRGVLATPAKDLDEMIDHLYDEFDRLTERKTPTTA